MSPLEKALMTLLEQVMKGADRAMPEAARIEKMSKMTDAELAGGVVSALAVAVSVAKLPKEDVLSLATEIVADVRAAERFKCAEEAKQAKGKAVTAGLADVLAGSEPK